MAARRSDGEDGEEEEEGDKEATFLISDGRIVSWLPAEKDEPPLFHCVHHDGDEEDLEEYEAVHGISAAAESRLEPNAGEKEVLTRLAKEKAEAMEEEEAEAEEEEEESEEEEEEEEEEDDEDEMGRGVANNGVHEQRLWRSAEARARWLALMTMETILLHGVSSRPLLPHAACRRVRPLMQKEPSKEVKARLRGRAELLVSCVRVRNGQAEEAWPERRG